MKSLSVTALLKILAETGVLTEQKGKKTLLCRQLDGGLRLFTALFKLLADEQIYAELHANILTLYADADISIGKDCLNKLAISAPEQKLKQVRISLTLTDDAIKDKITDNKIKGAHLVPFLQLHTVSDFSALLMFGKSASECISLIYERNSAVDDLRKEYTLCFEFFGLTAGLRETAVYMPLMSSNKLRLFKTLKNVRSSRTDANNIIVVAKDKANSDDVFILMHKKQGSNFAAVFSESDLKKVLEIISVKLLASKYEFLDKLETTPSIDVTLTKQNKIDIDAATRTRDVFFKLHIDDKNGDRVFTMPLVYGGFCIKGLETDGEQYLRAENIMLKLLLDNKLPLYFKLPRYLSTTPLIEHAKGSKEFLPLVTILFNSLRNGYFLLGFDSISDSKTEKNLIAILRAGKNGRKDN